MLGPQAPKDPEKQRPFFYIMKDKTVYGSKQPDGRGIQFLYESDGRLESSAKVVGNVSDEEIIKLLGTVDGFKKLVHSIGVSIEMDNPEKVSTFLFQMYGKKDLYGGGTNLTKSMKSDGNEQRIYLADVKWSEDDNIPGQIQIIMDVPDETAVVSVRFYLNDGFEAPPQDEEKPVNTGSEEYKKMIANSLIQLGNTTRLYKAIEKSKSNQKTTIAYIGGSITQGAGATPDNTECYAFKSFSQIENNSKNNQQLSFIKAGVGGTPSELGMIRFDRDVLRENEEPDIVVIEFAVNDAGDETEGDCYESLVRKVLKMKNEPAVILLFSVFADDYNLEERLIPVGKRYDLPMVSIKRAVTPQFYDRENRIITKNQFFYDCFHPTNLGHTIMADCIQYCIDQATDMGEYDPRLDEAPAIGNTFDDVFLMDRKDSYEFAWINEGAFDKIDNVLQECVVDDGLEPKPQFPYNWMYDGLDKKGSFEMDIECKALILVHKDSGEVDAAKAMVYVDGKEVRLADPYINRWLHTNPIIIINEKETGKHHVEIRVIPEDIEKKFTILGFGVVR